MTNPPETNCVGSLAGKKKNTVAKVDSEATRCTACLTVRVPSRPPLPRERLLGLEGPADQLSLVARQRDTPPPPAGQADAVRPLDFGVPAFVLSVAGC